MQYEVAKLEGALLDAAVAQCEGVQYVTRAWGIATEHEFDPAGPAHEYDMHVWKMWRGLQYSTDWELAGPIIEREGITVVRNGAWSQPSDAATYGDKWEAGTGVWVGLGYEDCPEMDLDNEADGPTPLIAAMRCYVRSKCGDTMELPA